jgi:hypothetical protein
MIELRLVGWSKGLQTVSLIRAICEYAGAPLPTAKLLVEDLLAGHPVTVSLPDKTALERFRHVASSLGGICE